MKRKIQKKNNNYFANAETNKKLKKKKILKLIMVH